MSSAGTAETEKSFHWAAPAVAAVALVAAGIGAGLSGYLAVENLRDETGICVGVHGCATVQESKYGEVLGVPVSVPGLLAYVVLALAAVVWLSNFRGLRPQAALVGFFVAFASVLFSAYLTVIEAFVLDAWCSFCIASALLTVVLVVAWAELLRRASAAESR